MRLLSTSMRVALATLPVAALLATAAPSAFAQVTSYTSSASFLAAVQPGFYTETFSSSSQPNTFSSNGFGYTVSAGTGTVYHNGTFIGDFNTPDTLIFTFTTGNVTAVGANFYNTDTNDAVLPNTPVTLTLNFADGTNSPFTFTAAGATTYNGYTSSKVITSFVMSAPATAGAFNTVDNLTVGVKAVAAATPEPGAVALLGAGVLPLIGMAVRRRKNA